MQGVSVASVSCTAQTTPDNIIQKLVQMCGNPVTTNAGRVLRPKVSTCYSKHSRCGLLHVCECSGGIWRYCC